MWGGSLGAVVPVVPELRVLDQVQRMIAEGEGR
jgi:hypothetical protein